MDISSILVNQKSSIKNALEVLNKTSLKIVFIVDEHKALVGSITDGDVRRGLLRGINISDCVTCVMNHNPLSVFKDSLESHRFDEDVEFLPVIDQNKVIVDIIQKPNTLAFDKENSIVIMAGGLGTRLGELTRDCPKPMLKIGDKPILERVIDQIKNAGFKNFTLAVNYKSDVIKNYFGNGKEFNIAVDYIEEEKRLGTAGALSLFNPQNDHPLIITNGDVLTDINFSSLLAWHNTNFYDITVCFSTYTHQIPFGILVSKNSLLESIKEKPVLNFDIAAGIYVVNKSVLNLLKYNEHMDMPNLLMLAKQTNLKIGMYKISNYWLDVGRESDLNKARADAQD